MEQFRFFLPTKIHFGAGKLAELGTIAARYSKRCMLVTTSNDETVLRPLYDRVKKILGEQGIDVYHFDEVVPNPTIGSIEKAIQMVNEKKIELIISVGGGSSSDTAKSIALFYGAGKVDWQDVFGTYTDPFAEYEPLSNPILPIIAVPTTAGTGSELTQAMVISDPDNDEKMCIFHDKVFPNEAIIDSELMRTLPRRLTAITGFDAFSHAFESYMREVSSPYTKLIGLEAMKIIIKILPLLLKDLDNNEYRDKMAQAEMFAGISLANAAASIPHPLSEIIGGISQNIPHGQCLASLYPEYVRFEISSQPEKCAEIACLFEDNAQCVDTVESAGRLEGFIINFLSEIGLHTPLSKLGVTEIELAQMQQHFLLNVLPFASKEVLASMIRNSF